MQQWELNILHVNEFIHSGSQVLSCSGAHHMTRVTTEIEINGELLIIENIYKSNMMADHITSLQKNF